MNKFYQSVAEVLEVESVEPETDFRAVEGWCSLKAFGLLVLMENDWQAPLTIDELASLRTARDLFRAAFIAFAAGFFKVDRQCLGAETAYGSIAAWDSVNHLRLVMEAEARFGVAYAMERIPEMKKLEDFLI